MHARRSRSLAAGYEALQAQFRSELARFVTIVFDHLDLDAPPPIEDIAATFIAISNGCALAAGDGGRQAGRAMRTFLDMVIKASRPRAKA